MYRTLAVQACSLTAQRDCLPLEASMPLRLLCALLVASPDTDQIEKERALEALIVLEDI